MSFPFKIPFAASGDQSTVPDSDLTGSVNFTDGYTPDYQADPSLDPNAKLIERDKFNFLMNKITGAVGEIQRQGYADWYADLAPYSLRAIVVDGGKVWQNTIANNTAQPSAASSGWAEVPAVADARYLSREIGETLHVIYGNAQPPRSNPLYRYILLTANQAGAGQYNEGILVNQVTTGSGATLRVTAEIDLPESPLHGQVIDLINTSGATIKAGSSGGAFALDHIQNVTGHINLRPSNTSSGGVGTGTTGGALSYEIKDVQTSPNTSVVDVLATTSLGDRMYFDASMIARTGNHTKVKDVTAVYYLRVL